MRYLLLLSVVAIIALLVYVQFTSASSIFSPKSEVRYEDIQPAVDDMQQKIDTYNSGLNESIGTLDNALK